MALKSRKMGLKVAQCAKICKMWPLCTRVVSLNSIYNSPLPPFMTSPPPTRESLADRSRQGQPWQATCAWSSSLQFSLLRQPRVTLIWISGIGPPDGAFGHFSRFPFNTGLLVMVWDKASRQDFGLFSEFKKNVTLLLYRGLMTCSITYFQVEFAMLATFYVTEHVIRHPFPNMPCSVLENDRKSYRHILSYTSTM